MNGCSTTDSQFTTTLQNVYSASPYFHIYVNAPTVNGSDHITINFLTGAEDSTYSNQVVYSGPASELPPPNSNDPITASTLDASSKWAFIILTDNTTGLSMSSTAVSFI